MAIYSYPSIDSIPQIISEPRSAFEKNLQYFPDMSSFVQQAITYQNNEFLSRIIEQPLQHTQSQSQNYSNELLNRHIIELWPIRRISSILPPSITPIFTHADHNFTHAEKTEMNNWIERREKYLDENPDLEKTEDKCAITQDYIFDPVSLEEENGPPFFERHTLLSWLLSTPTPQHPINHTEVSRDDVIAIFKAGIAGDEVKENEENDFDLYT